MVHKLLESILNLNEAGEDKPVSKVAARNKVSTVLGRKPEVGFQGRPSTVFVWKDPTPEEIELLNTAFGPADEQSNGQKLSWFARPGLGRCLLMIDRTPPHPVLGNPAYTGNLTLN